jgi:threonine aldolase
MIDIRSDTVTQPTDAMRKAMAAAKVGDDVYGDDPTVRELEALGAAMLGKEASLFVPSGTFGNQLALFTWCPRGSEALMGEECHIIQHEAGAASVIAGVQTRTICAPDGVLPPDELEARVRKADLHAPGTSVICVENAHSNGTVVALENMRAVRSLAQKYALPVHLDGARIFNAACALKVSAAQIASCADSVMCCLSKGLCAPVGSLLAGEADFVAQARLKRKIMGGGMRQAGFLAAAGIVALNEMTERLDEDHAHAKKLAERLGAISGICVDKNALDINMVFFTWDSYSEEREARALRVFNEAGIALNESARGVFRMVTHYWIGDAELDAIINAAKKAFL